MVPLKLGISPPPERVVLPIKLDVIDCEEGTLMLADEIYFPFL